MATQPVLLLDAVFSFLIASVYAFIGVAVWKRRAQGAARGASTAFAVWWFALAVMAALAGVLRLLAGLDELTLPLLVAGTYVEILPLCVSLWALLDYLTYLFTGRSALRIPLAFAYGILFVALTAYLSASRPIGFEASGWRLGLVYANPPTGWPFGLAVLALFAPQVLGVLGYLRLSLVVTDPTRRYRIALVACAILAWFGSSLLVPELDLVHASFWPLASRIIGLAAAWAILLAYAPPEWVRRRYRVRGLFEELRSVA